MKLEAVFQAATLAMVYVVTTVPCVGGCEFFSADNTTRTILKEFLDDDNVRLVDYSVRLQGFTLDFWREMGGVEWFRPWRWYRAKGQNSERLLLLFHYYYGLLKPYLGIGTETLDLDLEVDDPDCLEQVNGTELEGMMRRFLYYDLKNETERQTATFKDESIVVCNMHVGEYDGWGRLLYRCCRRDDEGNEWCNDVTDDAWVWTLRAFIILFTILLFLYFPKFIPKGYWVYSFYYYPPDGKNFNIILTSNPRQYKGLPHTTVLPTAIWKRMRKLAAHVTMLQPEVVHNVKVKRACFEIGMDRLLSETSSPVSAFRTVFDSLVRCKVRHADPVEDCCNTPVCGELCCARCPVWHTWLRALRTILLLGLMAVPALPILYAMSGEDLVYQELASVYEERGLKQSSNFYPGSAFGKAIVAILASLYLLHGVLLVVDGCHDQNLARAYTELLQVTSRRAKLRDRINHSQSIVRKIIWPIKRFGVLVIPGGLILLAVLPPILLVYVIATSPVPKLIVHIFTLMLGKDTNRHRKTKKEMSKCRLLESVLFIVTLLGVFAVLTLSINFLVHVVVILLVSLIVDITFVMKFMPVIVLLLVYVRESFSVVNETYSSHHSVVLRHVLDIEADDIKREADKDFALQENKIFKIVPASAADPKGRAGKEEDEYTRNKLFVVKNGAVRMRTRSLVLFLDKDDIPYIPKKFLFHTTTMACPGSPGQISEAFLRAAGQFMRTVVFLLFVMLVVLAYADTYYISPTSQFFAILLTGAIPLVLRHFFLNPGSVSKVDTSTLRFQTQMDDKIESFMQSWVLEDVEVDKISLPKEQDLHYTKASGKDAMTSMTKEKKRQPGHPQANGRPGSQRLPPLESSKVPHKTRETRTKDPPKWTPTAPAGYDSYMTGDSEDMGGEEDFSLHQTFTDLNLEKDDGYQQQNQNSSTLESNSDSEGPKGNESFPFLDKFPVLSGVTSKVSDDGLNKRDDGPPGPPRIDLVLDIRSEQARSVYSIDMREKGAGAGRPSSMRWKRKSNLVRDIKANGTHFINFRQGEYAV